VPAAVVHSALPERLTAALDGELRAAGIEHAAHGDRDEMRAAETAAADARAVALVGPFRSGDVAEAVEATAPAGLPLLAPVATWAGITRTDEPGCGDPADHRGTILRLIARDTEVASRIAADLRTDGRRAIVVAGEHEYGVQLDGQLERVGLPRAERPGDADVVVLCGLTGHPEIGRAAALAPLPVVAFDAVQGADLGTGRDVRLALPAAPVEGVDARDLFLGVENARRAGRLLAQAIAGGAPDRAAVLQALRALGPFDDHGDPVDPPVWLWRASDDWSLTPDRPL
jgi:hypothetical protein